MQQLIGGDFEDLSEPQNHVGVKPQLVLLVVGDEGRDEADAVGDFLLGEASFLANPGHALAYRLRAGVDGRELESGNPWHRRPV